MAKSRTQTVLWIIVAIPVLIFLFVVGLWTFVIATTKPIHPDAHGIPAVANAGIKVLDKVNHPNFRSRLLFWEKWDPAGSKSA